MHLALYQPDIPQNLGSILRLCACLDVTCHVVEPCGFPVDDKRIRRAGMDYMEHVQWQRHASLEAFMSYVQQKYFRLILLTTKAEMPYTDVRYTPNDVLLLGRESAGVPKSVAKGCDICITIPMREKMRSLNVAMAGAIVLSEAVRQIAVHTG